ncbi:hypothetical protein KY358_05460 [Candidatus Woesearchaeota archaeon]|nr:hypothetical protein [Candidatus Woesearchaeota archaeon]
MQVFEAVPKQWGNSVGITIPKDIIKKEHICPKRKARFLIIGSDMDALKRSFGSLKLKKPAQEAMDEIDEGYD